ncbi:MAG TPA: PilZ domain-containing protein [Polyangiaceae bacterium]
MNLIHLQERRAIRRAIKIDCEVVRERDFKLVGRTSFDVSTDGMLVSSDLDVEPGEELLVSFQAMYGVHIDTEAKVARIVRGLRAHDQGPCVGVEFKGLDPVSRHILRGSLRKVPPPLPRRARREVRIDYARTVLAI